jgi:hypothetical protein
MAIFGHCAYGIFWIEWMTDFSWNNKVKWGVKVGSYFNAQYDAAARQGKDYHLSILVGVKRMG